MQQEKMKQKKPTTSLVRRNAEKVGEKILLDKSASGSKELRKHPTVPMKPKKAASPSTNALSAIVNSPQLKVTQSSKHVAVPKNESVQKTRTTKTISTISKTNPVKGVQSEDRLKRPSIKQSPRNPYESLKSLKSNINRNGVTVKRNVSKVNKVMDVKTNVTVQSPIQSPSGSPRKVTENIKRVASDKRISSAVSPPVAFEIDLAQNGRVRTQTRTLDPSEIKFQQSTISDIENYEQIDIVSSTVNDKSNKISTAYEINLETNEVNNLSKTDVDNLEDDYDYDDDFESYESDFESFNSTDSEAESEQSSKSSESSFQNSDLEIIDETTEENEISDAFKELKSSEKNINLEEERKLDSGNYDLRQKYVKTVNLSNKINSNVKDIRKQSLTEIATDEGFVEQINKHLTKTDHFIDFSHMKNKIKSLSAKQEVNKRGKEILEKLALDTMSFTIFDMQPLTYNEYMNVYGNANCVQISSQTNEDNLSVEIQTENIIKDNKWTQHPVSYAKYVQEDESMVYKTLCVGDDNINKQECINTDINTSALNTFLEYASKQMLLYLEETCKPKMEHNKQDIAFSDCHYKIKCSFPFLANMSITKLCYFSKYNMLLSVHVRKIKDNSPNTKPTSLDVSDYDMPVRQYNHRSIICGWHINNQKKPLKILATWGEVTSVTFGGDTQNIVIAGMKDGSIACWDLEEPSCYHGMDNEYVLRVPSHFILENKGAFGPIIDLKPLRSNYEKNEITAQICTLNEYGVVKIWTVVPTEGIQNTSIDQGLSFWSKIRLVNSHSIQLRLPKTKMENQNEEFNNDSINIMRCIGFTVDSIDPRLIYIIVHDLNFVIGCFVNWDNRFKFYSTKADIPTCITQNPYNRPWFAVGCINSVQIFNRGILHPLEVIPLFTDNQPVQDLRSMPNKRLKHICWSPSNPQILFVSDNKQFMTVDITSVKVVNHTIFEQNIVDMNIYRKQEKDYIVLNYDKQIEVHKINRYLRSKSRRHTQQLLENLTHVLKL